MTPAARVQAAIEVLDTINAGMPAEQALTRWARQSRFAGSKDRRAVRDHVFDVLRKRRSVAALGGGESGRHLILGALRAQKADLDQVFTGDRHAPERLSAPEIVSGHAPNSVGEIHDLPDWIWPEFERSLGPATHAAAQALRDKAPVFIRANALKATREEVRSALATEGILASPSDLAPWALEITSGSTGLRQSRAFADGLFELQDAASQATVACLPKTDGAILDYCAGGGGKALALAARFGQRVDAWDIAQARMADLPGRATRAGAHVTCRDTPPKGLYPLVFCDAPCSGSGAWRRNPDGKWRLTQDALTRLQVAQDQVLRDAAACVAPGGWLIYVTCSLLRCENEDRVAAFLDDAPEWTKVDTQSWAFQGGADAFFTAHLRRV